MILDGHIHIHDGPRDRAGLVERLRAAGVDGGVLISLPPGCFREAGQEAPAEERLDDLLFWSAAGTGLYPFFWIDPLERDAAEQVKMAAERGVSGFKVICDRYYPGDERAMAVYRSIAQTGSPVLFHSGILWDGKPSSMYNRPADFEPLLTIDGLRFCLAHISWPWCDELIAVYGKFLSAYSRKPSLSVEMFIDITPGTPPIYRREALVKLYTVGYDVEHNVIFGSDCNANAYNVDWVMRWLDRDRELLVSIGLSQDALSGLYAGNLLRLLGASSGGTVPKRTTRTAE